MLSAVLQRFLKSKLELFVKWRGYKLKAAL